MSLRLAPPISVSRVLSCFPSSKKLMGEVAEDRSLGEQRIFKGPFALGAARAVAGEARGEQGAEFMIYLSYFRNSPWLSLTAR